MRFSRGLSQNYLGSKHLSDDQIGAYKSTASRNDKSFSKNSPTAPLTNTSTLTLCPCYEPTPFSSLPTDRLHLGVDRRCHSAETRPVPCFVLTNAALQQKPLCRVPTDVALQQHAPHRIPLSTATRSPFKHSTNSSNCPHAQFASASLTCLPCCVPRGSCCRPLSPSLHLTLLMAYPPTS